MKKLKLQEMPPEEIDQGRSSGIELKKVIHDFEDLVQRTERLFYTKYNLDESPILASSRKRIPRNGILDSELGGVKYKFHGNGCRFDFPDGAIIDFNYSPEDWMYGGFNAYNLHTYLYSINNSDWKISDIKTELKRLNNNGSIWKPNPTLERYKVFS